MHFHPSFLVLYHHHHHHHHHHDHHHHHHHHDHHHDEFASFSLTLPALEDPAKLETALKDVIERYNILRVKGFLNVEGRPLRHVIQGVGHRLERYFDRPWKDGESRQSYLIIIGQKGLPQDQITEAITSSLDAAA